MGTSIYSITSNVYVEMRDRRYRQALVRNRTMLFAVAAALASVLLVRFSYLQTGSVPLWAGMGMLLTFVSCLCMLAPERTHTNTVSLLLTAAGAAASVMVFL